MNKKYIKLTPSESPIDYSNKYSNSLLYFYTAVV